MKCLQAYLKESGFVTVGYIKTDWLLELRIAATQLGLEIDLDKLTEDREEVI